MFKFDGKIALITGAGRGLGVGLARALGRQGARVIINDFDPERAKNTVAVLRGEGIQAWAAPFDVTSWDAVSEGIGRASKEVGPIDILVNNAGNAGAGFFHQKPFADTLPDDWQPFIAVNLIGVLNCTRQVIGGMCERRWGRVITVSSDAGREGNAINVSIYGASKAGATHFMRHLSQEVARFGVTANSVALGLMNTVGEEWAKPLMSHIPVGRLGTPEDLGAACVYLASEEASWVTGSLMTVDGGACPF
jgi:NAD(P)-dependent dehydrogenase (short-subunit alcohol dehydrogenase family)